MKIIITEEQKKKLFIPRRIDERKKEIIDYLNNIFTSDEFNDDLENYIRDSWPDITDFNEWMEESGWDNEDVSPKELKYEISNYIYAEHFFDVKYDLMDYEKFFDMEEIVFKKIKEMGYLN